MKQSELIRKMRLERGLTQSSLSEGISSRTTLSSFENRDTELSSNTLFLYLDRLNIELEEFGNFLNYGKNNKKKELSRKLNETLEKGFVSQVLKEEIYQAYNDSDDFYFFILWFEAQVILEFQKGTFIKENYEEEIRKIHEYLFKIENWKHFEISIFTNLMFIFSDELIITLYKKVERILLSRQDYISYSDLIIDFFISGTYLGFSRHNQTIMRLFLDGLKYISDQSTNICARTSYVFFSEVLNTPNYHDHSHRIDLLFNYLELINLEDQANHLKEFYMKFND